MHSSTNALTRQVWVFISSCNLNCVIAILPLHQKNQEHNRLTHRIHAVLSASRYRRSVGSLLFDQRRWLNPNAEGDRVLLQQVLHLCLPTK